MSATTTYRKSAANLERFLSLCAKTKDPSWADFNGYAVDPDAFQLANYVKRMYGNSVYLQPNERHGGRITGFSVFGANNLSTNCVIGYLDVGANKVIRKKAVCSDLVSELGKGVSQAMHSYKVLTSIKGVNKFIKYAIKPEDPNEILTQAVSRFYRISSSVSSFGEYFKSNFTDNELSNMARTLAKDYCVFNIFSAEWCVDVALAVESGLLTIRNEQEREVFLKVAELHREFESLDNRIDNKGRIACYTVPTTESHEDPMWIIGDGKAECRLIPESRLPQQVKEQVIMWQAVADDIKGVVTKPFSEVYAMAIKGDLQYDFG